MVYTGGLDDFIVVMFTSEFMVIKLPVVTLVSFKNPSFRTVKITVSTFNFHVGLTANFCSVLV